MTEQSVVVLGAGAAGLMAARELHRAGVRAVVLEASDRIGGRIHTRYDTAAGVPVELGAEFIHGDAPETMRLLEEARLATVAVVGNHVDVIGRKWVPLVRPWRTLERVFGRIDPDREPDRSFQDFLDEKPGGRKLAMERELARGFVQGFFAADLARISEKSLASDEPTEGAAKATRIVAGYRALVAHLQREIEDNIRMETLAVRIRWDESGVRVGTRDGTEYEGRAAVITVPLPALQQRGLAFEPEIPKVREAARLLVMGDVARVTLVLRERFWEKEAEKLSFVHVPKRPFNVWWTMYPLMAPVVVGWSGGPPGLALNLSGDVESAAIGELAHAFRITRARAERLVESVHAHDWTHDPWIRGAYSYIGVGGTGAAKRLTRPIEGALFFAGEATDEETIGTVEAALASGKRAAKQVLRALS